MHFVKFYQESLERGCESYKMPRQGKRESGGGHKKPGWESRYARQEQGERNDRNRRTHAKRSGGRDRNWAWGREVGDRARNGQVRLKKGRESMGRVGRERVSWKERDCEWE